MKCENHPNVPAVALCGGCNLPVCGVCATFTNDGAFCERCARYNEAFGMATKGSAQKKDSFNELLEQGEKEETPFMAGGYQYSEETERRSDKWEKFHMAIVVLSCVFIAIRIGGSLADPAALNQDQVRRQVQARDQLENCMLVFWEIAAVLENGGTPDPSMSCAEAGMPNLITMVGGDLVVSHPRPELHGYSEIVVSRSNPVPRLVQ